MASSFTAIDAFIYFIYYLLVAVNTSGEETKRPEPPSSRCCCRRRAAVQIFFRTAFPSFHGALSIAAGPPPSRRRGSNVHRRGVDIAVRGDGFHRWEASHYHHQCQQLNNETDHRAALHCESE